jgi:glutamate/tyrosine decarboxylase-like PLP-dependent enzyme
MIDPVELDLLRAALLRLAQGFEDLPGTATRFDLPRAQAVLDEAARRMQDNYPYHHPLYAGQMLKPPHPVARIAYAMSLWINPNNHALDGGRASSALEKECVESIGRMFGWSAPLAHLTGGGTVANLEALWIAGRLHPGKRILASSQAHYTHARLCEVLGLPFAAVDVDAAGRMNTGHLRRLLAEGDVGTVVATIGTTGLGAIDPLPEILQLAAAAGARVHADAAYGGYFTLAGALRPAVRSVFAALAAADSIVVDPHKHGLQPYGCGCVLFRDRAVGQYYKHDSPYTYFSSADLHLGEISLECSRPGAAAVALWATQQFLPLERDGEFARSLDRCLHAAQEFHRRLADGTAYRPLLEPELDIVVYAPAAADSATVSARSRAIFERAAEAQLHLSLVQLPADFVLRALPNIECNTASVTCLRSVLMKPEHGEWLDAIVAILESAAARARE